jgi:hypothetical protein
MARIFELLAHPQPDTMADLSQHLPNIPAVFGALKAWEDELEPFMVDSKPVAATLAPENEEAHCKGKRKAMEGWEESQAKVNRVRAQENACLILQEVGVSVAQQGVRREHEELMKEWGWVEYVPNANTP